MRQGRWPLDLKPPQRRKVIVGDRSGNVISVIDLTVCHAFGPRVHA
jgi:hypothetical protein